MPSKKSTVRELHKQRRAAGLCRCGRQPEPDRKRCLKCLQQGREATKRVYRRRVPAKRALGLCIAPGCLREAAAGRSRCGMHLEANQEVCERWHKRNEAAGLCRCGRELVPGGRRCAECREKSRKATAKFQAKSYRAGLCRCGNKPVKGRTKCEKCLKSQREASARYKSKQKEERCESM